jgi:hypothetical protein
VIDSEVRFKRRHSRFKRAAGMASGAEMASTFMRGTRMGGFGTQLVYLATGHRCCTRCVRGDVLVRVKAIRVPAPHFVTSDASDGI